MKEYSKGIYVKFKPEEVEILHDRMKEAGVQNMSAYICKWRIPTVSFAEQNGRIPFLNSRISTNLCNPILIMIAAISVMVNRSF